MTRIIQCNKQLLNALVTVYCFLHGTNCLLTSNSMKHFLDRVVFVRSRLDSVLLQKPTRTLFLPPPSVAELQVEREFSDHCFVSFSVSLSKPLPLSDTSTKVFMYSKGNYDSMRNDITNFDTCFFSTLHNNSVNENWLSFKHTLQQSMARNISTKIVRTCNRKPPWLEQPLKCLIKRRDKLGLPRSLVLIVKSIEKFEIWYPSKQICRTETM